MLHLPGFFATNGRPVKMLERVKLKVTLQTLYPLRRYNLALVRLDLHGAFSGETELWEGVCNRHKAVIAFCWYQELHELI